MKPPERFRLNIKNYKQKNSVDVFKNIPFPMFATKKRKKKPKAISNSRTPFSKGCHQQKNRREKNQSNLKFQDSLFQGCHQKNIRREKVQSNHKCQDSLFQGLPPNKNKHEKPKAISNFRTPLRAATQKKKNIKQSQNSGLPFSRVDTNNIYEKTQAISKYQLTIIYH